MGVIDQWGLAVQSVISQFQQNMSLWAHVSAWLCGIHLVNMMMRGRLCVLGIMPRTWHGFIGILWAPLLHANGEHLLSNVLILVILGNMVAIQGQAVLWAVTWIVVLVGGLATWCFGRRALHVGASGVAMGYFAFVLMHAYQQPGLVTVGVAAVMLYYLSSLFMNLMPMGRQDSWESHLFGFLAGLLASEIYPTVLSWAWVHRWLLPAAANPVGYGGGA